MKTKKISVIIPTYNEANNITLLYQQIKKVLAQYPFRQEFLFIDNCSNDNTLTTLKKLQKSDKAITIMVMSRNFGSSQPSYLAGIRECTGNCAVLIDSDLQDPPKIINKFIEKWQEGYEVVYGVRIRRKGSLLRRIGYKLFYRLFNLLAYIHIPLDTGDFSLIDRKVIEEMKKVSENDYYIRGVRAFVGFKQIGVNYVREDRFKGISSSSFWENIWWAKKSILNFSCKPLEIISLIALLISFISFLAILFYFYLYIFTPDKPRGIPTIITLVLFLGSIQLLSISILAEYIAKIFSEVKRRPNYIIKKIYRSK